MYLIDIGSDDPLFLDTLEKTLEKKNLLGICISHRHKDHYQGLKSFLQRRPAPVYAFPHSIKPLTPRLKDYVQTYRPNAVLQDPLEGISQPYPVTLTTDCAEIMVLHTKGHTEDHACFEVKEKEARYVLTGDFIMGWASTVLMPPESDYHAYLQSLNLLKERLENTSQEIVGYPSHRMIGFPSHGEAVPLLERIALLKRHRLSRHTAILRAFEKTQHLEDLLKIIYPQIPKSLENGARGTLLSHLLAEGLEHEAIF